MGSLGMGCIMSWVGGCFFRYGLHNAMNGSV